MRSVSNFDCGIVACREVWNEDADEARPDTLTVGLTVWKQKLSTSVLPVVRPQDCNSLDRSTVVVVDDELDPELIVPVEFVFTVLFLVEDFLLQLEWDIAKNTIESRSM